MSEHGGKERREERQGEQVRVEEALAPAFAVAGVRLVAVEAHEGAEELGD